MHSFGVFLSILLGVQAGQSTLPTAPGALQPLQTTPIERAPVEVQGQVLRFERQKFTLRLPLGWQRLSAVGQSAGLLASFAPLGTTGATLALSYSGEGGRTRLPDNLPSSIATALAKRYPGFQQTAKQRLTLSGADAWMLDGQVRLAGSTSLIRNRQVYICHQGRIYILTLTTNKGDFERLSVSLDRLLKSIEWLP